MAFEWKVDEGVVESLKGRLAHLESINDAAVGECVMLLAEAEAALASGVEWGTTDWHQGQGREQS